MNREQLFEEIDGLYEEYLTVWETVCNIESPTRYKAGVDAVGAYFAALAQKRGWQVERCVQSVSGDAYCITMNPDAVGAPICLSGHMDTVHELGTFGTVPVRRDEEKIYGPGVTDCKGGIVVGLLAMDALDRRGFRARPVRMILQSDEEVSSALSNLETVRFMCEKAKGAVAFLNLEGTNKGEVCLARKGILNLVFQITGREAHASSCATLGANAIEEAAHKILEIAKIKDDDGITCSCGVIGGGSVPNTVAGYCEVKVNIRFATEEQLAWVRRYMQELADRVYVPGCQTVLVQTSYRPPMELVDRNLKLMEQVNSILEKNGLAPLVWGVRRGGSDAAYITQSGIPCIDNLGIKGGNIHSSGEYAVLSSLCEAAKRIALLVSEI